MLVPRLFRAIPKRNVLNFLQTRHISYQRGVPTHPTLAYDHHVPQKDIIGEGELSYAVMPRDEFGVPAHIPPEVSTAIRHTYYVPPQFYPFIKKLADDTPALKPYMDKLILGQLTHSDYEEMFFLFLTPLKTDRQFIPLPYRSAEEVAREDETKWSNNWYNYRQLVESVHTTDINVRKLLLGFVIGGYISYLWSNYCRQYRQDMKLYYLEAPEHKINWVPPRGFL